MRGAIAGLWVVLLSSVALGQPGGNGVESIGLGERFRATGWTAMVARIVPPSNGPGQYEIRVYQHDLDGDRPIYVKPITLTGAGQLKADKFQRFWMYFQTQPIRNGLGYGVTSVKELQKDLDVYLCAPGGKQIARLPLTSPVTDIDPIKGMNVRGMGTKLVLVVSGSGRSILVGDYNSTIGITSAIEPVAVAPADGLPDNPLGYEAVDAVVWLDGDPAALGSNGSQALAALQDYVRYGGQLVVCQSTGHWEEDRAFGDMMPVDVVSVQTKSNMDPLESMAVSRPLGTEAKQIPDWEEPAGGGGGPYQMARVTARPGAVVDQWIDWKQDGSNTDVSPYLVRRGYGLGQVTYVAQSLANNVVPGNPQGWPHVWNRVFGWANDAFVPSANFNQDTDRYKRYRPANALDLGYPLVVGLNLGSKGAWLIFLAVVFFLVYWVVAGPGNYVILAVKKRTGLSWFIFGAAAVAATVLTVGVVKLVLRGPPEVKHISVVRQTAGEPAIVWSRFGLYIPRDGDQTMSLPGTDPAGLSYLSPFPEHPQQLGNVEEFPAPQDYDVPVRELKSEGDPTLTVPYRSSLKKFQARWVGQKKMGVAAVVQLDPTRTRLPLSGTLTNQTGVELSDVYLIFNVSAHKDWAIYIPKWANGTTLDVQKDLASPMKVGPSGANEASPRDGKVISDELAPDAVQRDDGKKTFFGGWSLYWFGHLHRSSSTNNPEAEEADTNFYFPVLTAFSRLPPMPNRPQKSSFSNSMVMSDDRVELINRGARELDCGPAIGAGELVVIGTSTGPLPIELRVNGSKVDGDGPTFHQYVLPIDRGPIELPATRPVH